MSEQVHPLVLSQPTQQVVDDLLDAAFDVQPNEILPALEQLGSQLELPTSNPSAAEAINTAFESAWHYGSAMQFVMNGQFQPAIEHFVHATTGFERLKLAELSNLSSAMHTFSYGIAQGQQLNITEMVESLQSIEGLLDQAGKYTLIYRPFLDHIKPDVMFAAAIPVIMQHDFANARILIEDAARAAEFVAKDYADESQEAHLYHGLSGCYLAFYDTLFALNQLQQFNFDFFYQETNDLSNAQRAVQHLAEVVDISENARVSYHSLRALTYLLEVTQQLARQFKNVLDSTYVTDFDKLDELRTKVSNAREAAGQTGPQGVILVRLTDQIENQINNFHRLAQPTKKDFGIFSGLVSAGAFITILLIGTGANAAFGLGIDVTLFMKYASGLALVAGFGYGAIKFWKVLKSA